MFTPAVQALYLCATTLGFALVARWTKAPRRRFLGALVAIAVFTALSAPIDDFGARHALWTYPSCHEPAHPPLLVYVGQATIFVGSIALLGWRVAHAFGGRGLALFVALVSLLGLARDFGVAALFPSMIRFGPMPASIVADLVAWWIVIVVALVVPRFVAGPSR